MPSYSSKTCYSTSVSIKNVGKQVQSSKKLIVWGLFYNYKEHSISLKHSVVSGKKQIFIDDKIYCEVAGSVFDPKMERSFEFDGYTGKLVVYEANKNTNYDGTKYENLKHLTLDQIEKTKRQKKHPKKYDSSDSDDSSEEDSSSEEEKPKKHKKHSKKKQESTEESSSEEEKHHKKHKKHHKKEESSEESDEPDESDDSESSSDHKKKSKSHKHKSHHRH